MVVDRDSERDPRRGVGGGEAIHGETEAMPAGATEKAYTGRGKDSRQILTQTFGLDDCLSI